MKIEKLAGWRRASACRGFWLSVDAMSCLALLGMLLVSSTPLERPSLLDLHLFKKENDLLLAWAKGFDGLSEAAMEDDFSRAFPGKFGEVFVDGKKIVVGEKPSPGFGGKKEFVCGAGGGVVASSARFFDRNVKLHELRLVVFK